MCSLHTPPPAFRPLWLLLLLQVTVYIYCIHCRWGKLQKDSEAHKARLLRALEQFKKARTCCHVSCNLLTHAQSSTPPPLQGSYSLMPSRPDPHPSRGLTHSCPVVHTPTPPGILLVSCPVVQTPTPPGVLLISCPVVHTPTPPGVWMTWHKTTNLFWYLFLCAAD